MPAEFDLIGLRKETQQFTLVGLQQIRFHGRNFFRRVRGSHPDDGVLAPQALHEFCEAARLPQNQFGDLI